MTNQKITAATDGTNPSRNHETAAVGKSFISKERRIQDALEDDEVWEALRSLHQLPDYASPAK
jgi:hypothetical protein